MNIFFLDHDFDKCAEYHIDAHVGKMQLEAAQLLTTTIWVDHYLGYIPRKLDSAELEIINAYKRDQPSIEHRVFTRYLPTHVSHPCAIWARTSLDNYYWLVCYAAALNSEAIYRGYKDHASFAEICKLRDPENIPSLGLTPHALAFKAYPELQDEQDLVGSYRRFYKADKIEFASWRVRGQPDWWDDV